MQYSSGGGGSSSSNGACPPSSSSSAQPPPNNNPSIQQPKVKKKRLTQACQLCRRKKIKCDGLRPSCKNCAKNSSPCIYTPSVRKRGRNSTAAKRAAAIPAGYAPLTSGPTPYERPLPPQTNPPAAAMMISHSVSASSSGQINSSHLTAASQPHSQQQSSMFQIGMPPPPPSIPQMAPPPPSLPHHHRPYHQPQPQINPAGSNPLNGGPVSLHLKRDPGFGQDPMEEAMYDPAKQAYEMSAHFMLPVNNFHFPPFGNSGPPPQPPAYSYGSGTSHQAGPSTRRPSGKLTTATTAATTATANNQKHQQPPMISSNFDPSLLAHDLSSAYVSAIAGMAATTDPAAASADHMNKLKVPKSSNAYGKSASNTPLDDGRCGGVLDPRAASTSRKMQDLRKKIRSIISSVWADTECGRSAGMAGVTLADDEMAAADDSNAMSGGMMAASKEESVSRPFGGSDNTNNISAVSPSGDSSMDSHLINIFFEYVYHQLPVIPKEEFYQSYKQGHVSTLLVCAMCSAASNFLNRIEDERKAIFDKYSQKVREQFHDACFEPNLAVVQTALIMTLCEYRHGSLHRAWVYLSMGFRLAIAMGYHHLDSKIRSGPVQSTAEMAQRETCRRTFWAAFLLDRYTAIGGGKPLGINDDDISVLLPLSEDSWRDFRKSSHAVPPLFDLEFFKPVNLSSICSSSKGSSVDGSSKQSSRNITPLTADNVSSCSQNLTFAASAPTGWDGKTGEPGALGHFIKLMAVVGQVAQHINSAKSTSHSKDQTGGASRLDKPSHDFSALDAALLHWKEELPLSLSYSEAKSNDAEPGLAVFVSSMHAIYYGAVIMLNRENMGLLRDLPGQLDVSTKLAIRSLERCRVAAMEIVEIAHHLGTLPSAMTTALLPWALFQAGTLLIHFMIAGSTVQAQEEARSAILTLDCALRDELSRYWNVSSKYHLVLSNMVKAWERTRQSSPTNNNIGAAGQVQQQQMSMQAQMQPVPMQLTPSNSTDLTAASSSNMQQQQQQQQQQQNGSNDRFSTLLKPYGGPVPGVPFNPNYMFTNESAQDSLNTLNAFLSQLSHEQAQQVNEGVQTYSLQNSGPYSAPFMDQKNASGHSHPGFNSAANDPMFNIGNQHPQHSNPLSAVDINGAGQFVNHSSMGQIAANSRLDMRRGSLPISSNGDLFTAPTSTAHAASMAAHNQASGNGLMTGSELDPLLFNPMTPFLQELQLFNPASLAGVGLNPNQQHPMGGDNLVSVGPTVSGSSSSLHDSGKANTTSHTSSSS